MRLPKKILSYSAVNAFTKTSTHRQWIQRYIYKEPFFETPELLFGKRVSDNLDKDNFFDWDEDLRDVLCKAPMYGIPEEVVVLQRKGYAIQAYLDRALEDYSKIIEFKTGKTAWTQERLDSDLQTAVYSWLIYENFNIIPEVTLCWLPTTGQREELYLTGEVVCFERKVTKEQIEATAQLFDDAAQRMSQVYQLYLDGHDLREAKAARELIKKHLG